MEEVNVTYRLIDPNDRSNVGQTAISPELALQLPGNMALDGRRLAMERSDWVDDYGKPKLVRSVVIDVEKAPGAWKIGTY
ncbi:hypothetical protein [Bradyrhizobium yuanmingense]|uniref:hypothetical protein n=1 Tax=Bradyrhizobium yuanmingense TaxID=108015 RepID=UPI0035154FE3